MNIDRTALDSLSKTIEFMNNTSELTPQDEHAKNVRFTQEAIEKMLDEGINFGRATGGMAHLNQSEADFRRTIKDTKNNLHWQLSIFNEGLEKWFDHGESPPPYYPLRVAIILSKAKLKDKEADFLQAYSKHFRGSIGASYEKLDARANKLGLIFDDETIKAKNKNRIKYLRQARSA